MKEIEAFRAAISNRHFAAAEDILSCLLSNEYLSDYTAEILEYIICEISNTLRRLSLRYQLGAERKYFQDMISSYYLVQFFTLEELRTDILKRCKCIFLFFFWCLPCLEHVKQFLVFGCNLLTCNNVSAIVWMIGYH